MHPLVGIDPAQALEHVVAHLADDILVLDFLDETVGGQLQQVVEHQRQAVFLQNPQDTNGGTAQAEGVLLACRFLVDAEDADDRVQPLGQRDGNAGPALRQGIAREARQVELLHRLGQLFRLAVPPGLVAPHDALHVRELVDHLGHEVAAAQHACTVRQLAITADLPCD